jgi:hypothetical protein
MLCYLFECICIFFVKYRVSLHFDKCSFFMQRFEYVGHAITAEGNIPASSKYDMVQEWPLPSTAKSLLSLVSLCSFYQRFVPWFEEAARELHRMVRQLSKKSIPLPEWTAPWILLFNTTKTAITSSPVLARFSTKKPTFLKTDWSASGMGFILMQPDGSK